MIPQTVIEDCGGIAVLECLTKSEKDMRCTHG